MILDRTCKGKESCFLLSNKRGGAALWFFIMYPSQGCCTFVLWWFLWYDKHTFQNQKLTNRLIVQYIILKFSCFLKCWKLPGGKNPPLHLLWLKKFLLSPQSDPPLTWRTLPKLIMTVCSSERVVWKKNCSSIKASYWGIFYLMKVIFSGRFLLLI